MSVHYLNRATELKTVSVAPETHRSVLMICDNALASEEDIKLMHDWIHETKDRPPKYACFAGVFSEGAHDKYDDLNILNNRDALTTWHDDETIGEIAYFFLETVTRVEKTPHAQVIICNSENAYESSLIEALKNWTYE